jgi:hypothetical protein
MRIDFLFCLKRYLIGESNRTVAPACKLTGPDSGDRSATVGTHVGGGRQRVKVIESFHADGERSSAVDKSVDGLISMIGIQGRIKKQSPAFISLTF